MLEVLNAQRLRELLAEQHPLRDLNLSGGDYRGIDLSCARLEKVDARGAQFTGAILTDSHWKDCRLDGASFCDSTADSLYMSACSLHGALFNRVRWSKAYWQKAT
ncbi:Pentapeptide repeats (8 copies) [compost metagenome]